MVTPQCTQPWLGTLARLCSRQGFTLTLACVAWITPSTLRAQDAVALGLRLLANRNAGNCIACHTLPGQVGVRSDFGPALGKVGTRYDDQTLRQWITDARLIKADTLMPPFGTLQGTHMPNSTQPILSAEQINQVVAALQSWR